jgi:hypothetical protein
VLSVVAETELTLDERIAALLAAPDNQPSTVFADILAEVATAIAEADPVTPPHPLQRKMRRQARPRKRHPRKKLADHCSRPGHPLPSSA